MRKIVIAGLVAGMAFAVGCKREPAERVQAEREDVIEQREEFARTEMEERQAYQEDIAERRQEMQEEIASEREELTQEQQDVAEARQEFQEESRDEAFGGAGEAGAQAVRGTIQVKKADMLTLNTEQGTRELVVTTETELTHLGRDVQLVEIPEGAEVRASYNMEANRMVADKIEVLSLTGTKDK